MDRHEARARSTSRSCGAPGRAEGVRRLLLPRRGASSASPPHISRGATRSNHPRQHGSPRLIVTASGTKPTYQQQAKQGGSRQPRTLCLLARPRRPCVYQQAKVSSANEATGEKHIPRGAPAGEVRLLGSGAWQPGGWRPAVPRSAGGGTGAGRHPAACPAPPAELQGPGVSRVLSTATASTRSPAPSLPSLI